MKKILLGILYWIGQLTWGIVMSVIGLITTLICLIFLKCKVHRNGFTFIVEFGGNWGGINLGCVSLCGGYTTICPDDNWFQHTRRHEFGHSLQNLIFGPLFPFIVALPSVIRCQYQNYRSKKGLPNKEYDSIWFEFQASSLGHKAVNYIENTDFKYTYKRK